MRVVRQVTVLCLLALLPGGPVVSAPVAGKAVPNRGANTSAPGISVSAQGLSTVWRVLAGFIMDPLGSHFSGSQGRSKSPSGDAECVVDPLGHCLPGGQGGSKPPSADSGCILDPLGACSPGH